MQCSVRDLPSPTHSGLRLLRCKRCLHLGNPVIEEIRGHGTTDPDGAVAAVTTALQEWKRLMSIQMDALRELVELFNARKAIDVPRFFTEDFQLEDPGAGVARTGLDGAQGMMEALRALAHDGHLEILDMFESGNRVAVRWSYKGVGASFAMMSIYEFNGKRILRDWGISARAPWSD